MSFPFASALWSMLKSVLLSSLVVLDVSAAVHIILADCQEAYRWWSFSEVSSVFLREMEGWEGERVGGSRGRGEVVGERKPGGGGGGRGEWQGGVAGLYHSLAGISQP